MFTRNKSEKAIYLEYDGSGNANKVPDPNEIGIKRFKGDGDFRSGECIELLKQADIVVTNPPFSLFREYLEQLMNYDKKFLIIGNINALTTRYIWAYVKENRMWLGPSISNGDREFGVPDHYPLRAAGYRVDESGKKYIRVKGVRWYTNLDHAGRHEKLVLHKKFSSDEYPAYDNYKAIEVGKVKHIPMDYEGVMGVPITFIDKYNPDQFEIIGSDSDVKYGDIPEYARPGWKGDLTRAYVKGKKRYSRIFIKRKESKP